MPNDVRIEGLNSPSTFQRALSVVLPWETGGRSDGAPHSSPTDLGGTTKWGISIRFAGSIGLDIDGDGRTTNHDVLALTREQAAEIYETHFWRVMRCGEMPYGLALAVFDGAVNQGTGITPRLLQRAAGVIDDGIIGPVTLAAVTRPDRRHEVLLDYMARRGKRYAGTATLEANGRGWYRRLLDIHAKARTAL